MAVKDPGFRNHFLRDAIGRAIYDQMKADPAIRLFGEGAHVKIHFDAPQIEREMIERVHTLPISEDGNLNFAIGASLLGVKPVVDVITADFLYRAMDSICNTAAKLNFISPDSPKTIVVRAEFLIGGPTTGQRPEALFTHIPGLNVVLPSTPADTYGLMRTALSTPGVTIFFEDRMIEDAKTKPEDCVINPVHIPFAQAVLRKLVRAPRVTVVTYGLARQLIESALDLDSLGVQLVDLRTLYPLDWEAVLESSASTGRLLVVEPDVAYGGIGAEIVAQVAERLPWVRVKRLGGPRMTIPASRGLHEYLMPNQKQIEATIVEMLR